MWGLEAKHVWDGAFTINDRVPWPRYKLRRITGLHDLPDIEDARATATARLGEVPLAAFRRGKTITYEGNVEARDLATLRTATTDLLGAFAQFDERKMVITPDPAYAAGTRFFLARPLTLAVADEVKGPFPHRRQFGLALRLSDPRIYDSAQVDQTSAGTAPSTGTPPPFTTPIEITSPAELEGTLTVTNAGNAPTDAIIELHGPAYNPEVWNTTISKVLRFYNVYLAAGNFLRIDFQRRTVKLNGTDDYRIKLHLPLSDWWDAGVPTLIPGANELHYRAVWMGAEAYFNVKHNAAYWG